MGRCGGGGPTFDRVIANEHGIYVRMYVYNGPRKHTRGFVIMKANDITQVKYMVNTYMTFGSAFIGKKVNIIIDNVTQNMGTSYNDAEMTTDMDVVYINGYKYSQSRGTWTSTILPDKSRVELDCEVVEVVKALGNSDLTVTAKCDSKTMWSESVFNRLSMWIHDGKIYFGCDTYSNYELFYTCCIDIDGSVPNIWNESIRYNMTGSGSNLTIGNQLTIMGLPESFVNHWVNTIHAEALMGNNHIMFVPPDV